MFWVQKAGAPYNFDTTNHKVDVTYTNVTANSDIYDAFFKCEDVAVSGSINRTVELRRPFAQINIGATDYAAAKAAGWVTEKTSVHVDDVYSTLNVFDATVSNRVAGGYTYTLAAKPDKATDGAFPVSGVDAEYQSMVYVLTGADQALTNVEFKAHAGTEVITRNYANVPVRRNYRTNIYGNILTEAANFTVQIIPEFNEPANNVQVEVSTAQELKSLATTTGGKAVLTQDVDLTELSSYLSVTANKDLEIDLNGNTLTLNETATVGQGKIGVLGGVLTISNGTIKSASTAPASSTLIAQNTGTLILENVTIDAPQNSPIMVAHQASLICKNTIINALYYTFATNASSSMGDQSITIDLENCTFTSETPFFINVPGTVTATDCTFNGRWQAALVRGGNATFTRCDFNLEYTDPDDKAARSTKFDSQNWGSGNEIPVAAMTIGNKAPSAYQYPTVVNLIDCDLACLNESANYFPAISACANIGTDKGVTLNYDAACTFTTNVSPKLKYDKLATAPGYNIVVNGTAVQ